MAIYYGRGPWVPLRTDPFFEGWAIKPSLEVFSLLLQQSDAVFFASDEKSGEIIGFLTAHTDGIMSAYISFVEVAPNYRAQGVGTALLRMALDDLSGLYMIDTVCDADVRSFYSKSGFNPTLGMSIRNYEKQGGQLARSQTPADGN